ncbi:uncharacterized protein STEHIDRAFT_163902 [Stereum hirsutum FP-91666 SS1]|uniref:F-box domain-containing protein n=1 Tax=Stereum hirsutum (strain FP-91666) TaxID=721885 RepID=R7RWP8_STEHR|nr:uncharacterized protein STEHIDRAFT_163902 [Stereum hirsutum FP-91666 SS1]EIM79245.1 hypothetical protein STEHIDRAFT_163902 [Stereum hirsutum FP-91666 SS1]
MSLPPYDSESAPSKPSGSALSRVPPELLAEFFLYSVRDALVKPRCDDTPLNIAAASREWRAVALSTPNLWARFSMVVKPEGKTDDQLKNFLPLLEMWLKRSQSAPLSFTLSFIPAEDDPERGIATVFYPLIRTLQLHSKCWVDVELHTPDIDYVPSPRIYMIDTDHPLLERLTLSSCLANDVALSLSPGNAPRLSSTTLPTPALLSCLLPWAQITTLHIRDIDTSPDYVHDIVHVLSHFSCLRVLHIQADLEIVFLDDAVPTRITLPYLTHFRIAINVEMILDALLAALDTPALNTLSFYGCSHATWSPSIATFVERHSQSAPSSIETVEVGFEGPPYDMVQSIRFWGRFSRPGPGPKCVGLHLDEGNTVTIQALSEYSRSMWVLGDRSGPVLEEVVLSFEMGYAYLHPDTFIKTVRQLTVLVDGERRGYVPQGDDAGLGNEDGRTGAAFFPCARMGRLIRMALASLVERGVELTFERAEKGCMFA